MFDRSITSKSHRYVSHGSLEPICFKGDSGAGEVKETAANRASAEVAMNNFNDYMETIKPFEDKYVADVSSDPTNRKAKVAGMVSADIAAKNGLTTIDPNKGQNASTTAAAATTMADAQIKGDQGVENTQAAGYQSVIDIGMGKNTTAQQGLSSLSAQSVAEASNKAEAAQKVEDASVSSAATAGGAAIGLMKNLYDDSKGKK